MKRLDLVTSMLRSKRKGANAQGGKVMARSFTKVYNQILEVAPESLSSALKKSVGFWAPEIVWVNLTQFVHRYVEPSSSDDTSVAVYAILCDCTEDEMRTRFKNNGL